MDRGYNTQDFPYFICNHGNWDIYCNDRGYCAAIPTQDAAAIGCKSSHFGDVQYVKRTLGVDPVLIMGQNLKVFGKS